MTTKRTMQAISLQLPDGLDASPTAFALLQDLVGCGEVPADLSTNAAYLRDPGR